MAAKKADKLTQLISLLESLPEEERLRTVNAALTFLGSTQVSSTGASASQHGSKQAGQGGSVDTETNLPTRASRWMQQNSLDFAAMESVFHFSDGEVQVIAADVPGKDNKEKTRHCYLLSGVRALLQDGVPRINDEEARELCREIGCYDTTNHAKYLKAIGNQITGTKSTGFELTQPGLRAAAETIKTIARNQ
ncbi:MAG TPA: hypothetical protein VJ842_05180 [Pyrinomonadaceae bacterium]|nr:hypothetical protein [Pyrinomonadaceae bacterium]